MVNPKEEILKKEEHIVEIIKGKIEPIPIRPDLKEIRTFLFDIEGTMYAGKGHDIDPALSDLYYTVFSIMDSVFPESTKHLVTGRPESYVEGISQSTHTRKYGPHVVENGGVVCQFAQDPSSTDQRIFLASEDALKYIKEVHGILLKEFPGAQTEPGKMTMMTLNPPDGKSIDEFVGACSKKIEELMTNRPELREKIHYTNSMSSFDILPKGVSKLSGVEYIVKKILGRDYDSCAAFGDSRTDMVILEKVVLPLTFPNGSKEVRGLVIAKGGLQSELPHGFGTIELLYRIMEHNIYVRETTLKRIYKLSR